MRGGTVLVVGATGQLGGPVASQLLRDGFVVRLLVRDVDRARRLLGAGFDHVQGDVTDPAAVRRALQGCDAVHVSLMGGRLRRELDTMSLLQRIGPADDGGDADKVLGPATTTLRQWCQQQRLGTAPA